MNYTKLKEVIKGTIINQLKNGPNLLLFYILFVDDVILFGVGVIEEWSYFTDIISIFCTAYGMEVSASKLTFHRNVLRVGMVE